MRATNGYDVATPVGCMRIISGFTSKGGRSFVSLFDILNKCILCFRKVKEVETAPTMSEAPTPSWRGAKHPINPLRAWVRRFFVTFALRIFLQVCATR